MKDHRNVAVIVRGPEGRSPSADRPCAETLPAVPLGGALPALADSALGTVAR